MKFHLLVGILTLSPLTVMAHEYDSNRPDAYAPLGVMGEHTHDVANGHHQHSQDVMFSYRYMRMEMDDNRIGTDTINDSQVFTTSGFPVAPTRMTMDMHMFGAMYAPNHTITLMAMLPRINLSMDHVVVPNGVRFTTKTGGFGDINLAALYSLYKHAGHNLHLNAGISLPTGSIDERGATPAAANGVLPYPMQLGSGTYDLMPGLTYSAQSPLYSWGAQAIATIRLGENDADYTLGNKLEMTGWLARRWNNTFSTSFRLAAQSWGNIDGADSRLLPIVPTAISALRGGERVDALLGLNYKMADFRLAAEVGMPVHQDLDGPQLETDWVATLGWQFSF